MTQVLAIALFGALGVLSRYGADVALSAWNTHFPWSTFLVNFAGCFLAGVIWSLSSRANSLSEPWTIALMVGFCGGFTTFSAYAVQALQMAQGGSLGPALRYAIATPMIALLGVYLGAASIRLTF